MTSTGLSMYFSGPFIVIGPCQLAPPSCELNSTTPGSKVFRNTTYIVPHPQDLLVSVATLICGSNCHPTPLQASPQTNSSPPQLVPPSADLRNRTLVQGWLVLHCRAVSPVTSW